MSNKLGSYELNAIVTGDARELARAIPDESVDLIFTDPPYIREFIGLYGDFAVIAARIIRPSGFAMFYTGQYWKDEVMALIAPHLEYYWDFVLVNSGSSPVMWNRRILSRNKSILCYRPQGGTGLPWCNVLSDFVGGGQDKRYHTWGQDIQSARYYIECFTRPGDVVLDFCMGGGTTAYVCKQLGRNYLGFEIDPATAEIARARVAQYQIMLLQSSAQQLAFDEATP